MNNLKRKNMVSAYTGFRGTATFAKVLEQVPDDLQNRLTGAELGQILSLLYKAYNNGKAAAGASIEDDCVWINQISKLIPLTWLDKNVPDNIHLL